MLEMDRAATFSQLVPARLSRDATKIFMAYRHQNPLAQSHEFEKELR